MKTREELAREIDLYAGAYSQLEMTRKSLNIPFAMSPLFNFRDALFHYAAFCEAADNEKKIGQAASITEHLFRGLKDGYFSIILQLKRGLYYQLIKAEKTARDAARGLRALLHQCKALELDMRGGIEQASAGRFDPYNDRFSGLIAETRTLFKTLKIPFDFKGYKKVRVV